MVAYVVRRCFIGVLLIVVLTFITHILFFSSPIDPARYACGKNCTEQQRDQTRKALGYPDRGNGFWEDAVVGPTEMWGKFMKGLVAGRDFPDDPVLREAAPDLVTHCAAPCIGYSHVNQKTVNDGIKEAAPVSISLAVVALVLWLTGGVLFGIMAAVFKGSLIDRGIVGLTLIAYAFPTFWIGLFLLKYVAISWQWLPIPSYTPIAEGGLGGWLSNLMLPAIVLALVFMAGYVRMTRAFVIESMSEDYIRTAKAKGLKGRVVLFKHGLRAALTPLVTMTGLDFATLLGGAIITEAVFAYPGLGLATVQANNAYDLPTIIGILVVAATFVIVANIVVDILYAVIDPRVRVG